MSDTCLLCSKHKRSSWLSGPLRWLCAKEDIGPIDCQKISTGMKLSFGQGLIEIEIPRKEVPTILQGIVDSFGAAEILRFLHGHERRALEAVENEAKQLYEAHQLALVMLPTGKLEAAGELVWESDLPIVVEDNP
jgi:hypothetical protein